MRQEKCTCDGFGKNYQADSIHRWATSCALSPNRNKPKVNKEVSNLIHNIKIMRKITKTANTEFG